MPATKSEPARTSDVADAPQNAPQNYEDELVVGVFTASTRKIQDQLGKITDGEAT